VFEVFLAVFGGGYVLVDEVVPDVLVDVVVFVLPVVVHLEELVVLCVPDLDENVVFFGQRVLVGLVVKCDPVLLGVEFAPNAVAEHGCPLELRALVHANNIPRLALNLLDCLVHWHRLTWRVEAQFGPADFDLDHAALGDGVDLEFQHGIILQTAQFLCIGEFLVVALDFFHLLQLQVGDFTAVFVDVEHVMLVIELQILV